jgi:hypothetical protein
MGTEEVSKSEKTAKSGRVGPLKYLVIELSQRAQFFII